jgi:two-component system, NarL family, response regulator NreC
MKSIILAVAQKIERRAIRSLLDNNLGVGEIKEAMGLEDVLVMLAAGTSADIVLLDTELDSGEEFLLLEKLTTDFPSARVIIMNTNADQSVVKSAFHLGVKGYLLKDCYTDELALIISQVASGKEMLCSSLGLKFLNQHSSNEIVPAANYRIELTRRELEILSLIAEGYTNTEIADKIFVSRRTVEGHRLNLINKLGVKNSAQLIKVACQSGLIVAA